MIHEETDTFFPELEGDERRRADAWLDDYLSLVIRIYLEHADSQQLSTASVLTDSVVLERSIMTAASPNQEHEEVLRVHTNIGPEAGQGRVAPRATGSDLG